MFEVLHSRQFGACITTYSGYKTQCSGRTCCDISLNSLVESWPLTGKNFLDVFCSLFLFFDLYLSLQVCLLAVIKSSVTNSVFTEVWFSVVPGTTL